MVVELHCDGQERQEAQVTRQSSLRREVGPLCRNLGVTHETVLAREVSILHAGSIYPTFPSTATLQLLFSVCVIVSLVV